MFPTLLKKRTYSSSLLQCMLALQSSPLPEAAEVLDILHQIEFESLFYTHDKLAERQVIHHHHELLCFDLIPSEHIFAKGHWRPIQTGQLCLSGLSLWEWSLVAQSTVFSPHMWCKNGHRCETQRWGKMCKAYQKSCTSHKVSVFEKWLQNLEIRICRAWKNSDRCPLWSSVGWCEREPASASEKKHCFGGKPIQTTMPIQTINF